MSMTVHSDATLMRGITQQALDLAAGIENSRRISQEEYSERLRVKTEYKVDRRLPKIYAYDWSQQIRRAARDGTSSVDIYVCSIREGDSLGLYDSMLLERGANLLRSKGYTVVSRQESHYSTFFTGNFTTYRLSVSW